MEYQKIINLLDNTPNQLSLVQKIDLSKWWRDVWINDGTHNTKGKIKFKTPMLKSSLYDYGDAYTKKWNIVQVFRIDFLLAWWHLR